MWPTPYRAQEGKASSVAKRQYHALSQSLPLKAMFLSFLIRAQAHNDKPSQKIPMRNSHQHSQFC